MYGVYRSNLPSLEIRVRLSATVDNRCFKQTMNKFWQSGECFSRRKFLLVKLSGCGKTTWQTGDRLKGEYEAIKEPSS
jgi:hypothetical protein